jgi:hypothetical protein
MDEVPCEWCGKPVEDDTPYDGGEVVCDSCAIWDCRKCGNGTGLVGWQCAECSGCENCCGCPDDDESEEV